MTTRDEQTVPSLLAAFDEHLRRRRGLCPGVRRNYVGHVRAFLVRVAWDQQVDLSAVTVADVVDHIGELTGRYRSSTVELAATALRSFFRFLRVEGLRSDRLENAVPVVPHRRGSLPRHLDGETFARLIAGLDFSTPRGQRDRAIILLMARLGLRSGEVTALTLEDIDWRNATIRVRARKKSAAALLGHRPAAARGEPAPDRRPVRTPRPDQHGDLRVGGPGRSPRGRPALAADDAADAGDVVNGLPDREPKVGEVRGRVEAYIALRRGLGYRSRAPERLLRGFAEALDAAGHHGPIGLEASLAWAAATSSTDPHHPSRRLTVIRGFLRHLSALDGATQVPAPGLLGPSFRRTSPHVYSEVEIADLTAAALDLDRPDRLRPYCYATLFGLLACTGLRIAEALALSIDDVDLTAGMLTVRAGKRGRTRWVPLHPTTLAPLRYYAAGRARYACTAFFRTDRSDHLSYNAAASTFTRLRQRLGWTTQGRTRLPRIHDYADTCVMP